MDKKVTLAQRKALKAKYDDVTSFDKDKIREMFLEIIDVYAFYNTVTIDKVYEVVVNGKRYWEVIYKSPQDDLRRKLSCLTPSGLSFAECCHVPEDNSVRMRYKVKRVIEVPSA